MKDRPKRIPLGSRNILTAPQRDGYVRRFVNDEGDRIKQFEQAGFEVVRKNIEVGDTKAGKGAQMGKVVSPSVGAGQRAVLMEIKQEFYDEDQKTKQEKVSISEKDMKRQLNSNRDGTYGKVEIT